MLLSHLGMTSLSSCQVNIQLPHHVQALIVRDSVESRFKRGVETMMPDKLEGGPSNVLYRFLIFP